MLPLPYKIIHYLHSWRKILGYIGNISPIYLVSGGGDMAFPGEKSEGRFFTKNRQ